MSSEAFSRNDSGLVRILMQIEPTMVMTMGVAQVAEMAVMVEVVMVVAVVVVAEMAVMVAMEATIESLKAQMELVTAIAELQVPTLEQVLALK